jgi:hypothetical protein
MELDINSYWSSFITYGAAGEQDPASCCAKWTARPTVTSNRRTAISSRFRTLKTKEPKAMATAESDQSPQLVQGVDFVALPAEDLQRALDFYGGTLGLRRSVYLSKRGYAEFETGTSPSA